MKNIILATILISGILRIQAQTYQLSFAGTGASVVVDSVKVDNMTQNTSLSLGGNDILNLLVSVGISEDFTGREKGINIFPNPMKGSCTFSFNATTPGQATLELFDVNGKRILQWEDMLSMGNQTFSLSGICSGMYTLKISANGYAFSSKVVSTNAYPGIAAMNFLSATPVTEKNSHTTTIPSAFSSKSTNTIIDMPYTGGDILKISGMSGGVFKTIKTLIPTQSQTLTFDFTSCTDADSNHYAVVQIGTQIWMGENLNTNKYRNGDSIPTVAINSEWQDLITGATCNYDNNDSNAIIYGKLYNWFAVNDNRNIAPVGWHVPTYAEWMTMANALGGTFFCGGKLKEAGTSHWMTPNTGATNESGFTGLAARWRDFIGSFIPDTDELIIGGYWSATEQSPDYGLLLYLDNMTVTLTNTYWRKECGLSIRCVKD